MNHPQAEFRLVVVANERCARFFKFLPDEYRLIEQTTIARATGMQRDLRRFADEIAAQVAARCAADPGPGVCLIAPQPFLGVLETSLTNQHANRIAVTRASDLTALSEDHILVRITDLISALEAG